MNEFMHWLESLHRDSTNDENKTIPEHPWCICMRRKIMLLIFLLNCISFHAFYEISGHADVYVPDTKAGKPLWESSLNRIQFPFS